MRRVIILDVTKKENQKQIKESQMYLMAFSNIMDLPSKYVDEIIETEI